jgi:hypothetical protein
MQCSWQRSERARQALPAGARRGLMLWRSALRADSAVVLALKSRPELASPTSFATLKQAGRSQFWMRAARADFKAALLAATEIAPCGPRRAAPAARKRWLTSSKRQPAILRLAARRRDTDGNAPTRIGLWYFVEGSQSVPARQAAPGGVWWGRFLGRRAAQDWRRRAKRASTTDSPRLFERSERSEFCGATPGRAGSPGHEQSSGLFVPGERPGRLARRGLQGQCSRRAAPTAPA